MGCRHAWETIFILAVLLVGEYSRGVQSVSTEQDLTLTSKEKHALDAFKKRVLSILPHDYMKQDIYLIRWLRAKNLDLNQAEVMLRENLKWRQENNIDTVLDEDFTDMERDFPYQIRFHDKEGKPIITANFGDWNIRTLALAGKLPLLNRHFDRSMENVTKTVRKLQEAGQVVTQFDFIINMENYNLVEQGCIQCIPFYIHVINSYEQHYPLSADKLMLINTPTIFELVLNVMRPFMSPVTRQSLQVYGTNKQQWQHELLKIVDKNELPIEYGGTKEV